MKARRFQISVEWPGRLPGATGDVGTFGLPYMAWTLIERRSWREWVPFALVVSVGAHLLFKTWLGVPLPGGLLGI